jgi:hypothetical protein
MRLSAYGYAGHTIGEVSPSQLLRRELRPEFHFSSLLVRGDLPSVRLDSGVAAVSPLAALLSREAMAKARQPGAMLPSAK